MKAFLKGVGIVAALTIAGMILAAAAPQIGVWVGLAFFVVPLVAVIKPLPQIHLGHRVFSLSLLLFVGFLTMVTSYVRMSDTQRLADLRVTDPTAYLAALEGRNEAAWLSELKELNPERHAAESAKIAEEEAILAAEKVRVEAEQQKAAKAEREVEEEAKIVSYIEQLDREIASIPGVLVSKYTGDIFVINNGLLLIGAWALLYENGEYLNLNEDGRQRRQKFRQLLVRKQAELLPVMRDAYGPAMRKQLWEADGSARTIGAGYRTVEFVSATFARNANIKQIHLKIRENLMMLRFTRAQYKWFKQASKYSFYKLEVPKDSDIVKWKQAGRYRVLK